MSVTRIVVSPHVVVLVEELVEMKLPGLVPRHETESEEPGAKLGQDHHNHHKVRSALQGNQHQSIVHQEERLK